MGDEELIAYLRLQGLDKDIAAADRIEALVKERDAALEWLSASQGYIADAVFALDKQEKAEAQIAALTARVEGLTVALEWYAKDGWNDRSLEPPTPEEVEVFGDNILDFPMPEIFFDRGERARAALSTTEEGK